MALINYYAIKRYIRVLSLKYDVEITGALSVKRSQAFNALKAMLLDAEAECVALGFNVGSVQGFEMGLVNLDFLEPSLPTEFFNDGILF